VKDTVARLKQVAEALDAATTASKKTLKEVARAKRAVIAAKQNARVIDVPLKIGAPQKRRSRTAG
jgi:hypothetical protein